MFHRGKRVEQRGEASSFEQKKAPGAWRGGPVAGGQRGRFGGESKIKDFSERRPLWGSREVERDLDWGSNRKKKDFRLTQSGILLAGVWKKENTARSGKKRLKAKGRNTGRIIGGNGNEERQPRVLIDRNTGRDCRKET